MSTLDEEIDFILEQYNGTYLFSGSFRLYFL